MTSPWPAGTEILRRYRGADGAVRAVEPCRVVRDDADGLVMWLAPATPVLRPVLSDGSDLRSVPVSERFDVARHGRATRLDTWKGPGILGIAPPATPWSVWLFWSDGWLFRRWYVNLEDVHQRTDQAVVTRDRVLDVVVEGDRSARLKDEDELAAAVSAGRFTAAEAAGFRDDALRVEAVVRRWGRPFCDRWERWRPDPTWPVPALPDALAATADYR